MHFSPRLQLIEATAVGEGYTLPKKFINEFVKIFKYHCDHGWRETLIVARGTGPMTALGVWSRVPDSLTHMHDLYRSFMHVAYGRGLVVLRRGDKIPRERGNFGGFLPH